MKVEFYNHWKQLSKGLWYIIFLEINGGEDSIRKSIALTILNFEIIIFLKKR